MTFPTDKQLKMHKVHKHAMMSWLEVSMYHVEEIKKIEREMFFLVYSIPTHMRCNGVIILRWEIITKS